MSDKFCPECGEKNLETATFCQNCGNNLQKETKESRDKIQEIKAFEKELGKIIYYMMEDVIEGFKKRWNEKDTKGKATIALIACCLGVVILIGIFGTISSDKTTPTTYSTKPITIQTNNSSPTSTEDSKDKNLEDNVKKGVESFFKDFNSMYNEDGVNKGYLIKTINIDSLNKISDNEVEVTVSLNKIASNGDEFDSIWGGKLYLKNGKWVDNGDFVQTYSYNKATGEKVKFT